METPITLSLAFASLFHNTKYSRRNAVPTKGINLHTLDVSFTFTSRTVPTSRWDKDTRVGRYIRRVEIKIKLTCDTEVENPFDELKLLLVVLWCVMTFSLLNMLPPTLEVIVWRCCCAPAAFCIWKQWVMNFFFYFDNQPDNAFTLLTRVY